MFLWVPACAGMTWAGAGLRGGSPSPCPYGLDGGRGDASLWEGLLRWLWVVATRWYEPPASLRSASPFCFAALRKKGRGRCQSRHLGSHILARRSLARVTGVNTFAPDCRLVLAVSAKAYARASALSGLCLPCDNRSRYFDQREQAPTPFDYDRLDEESSTVPGL